MTISPTKESALVKRMLSLGIIESDLEESFVRSSGAGGQKVNKASTCVVLRHIPTGIEVKCQISRSQIENRFYARRILCDRYESQVLKIKTEKDYERFRIRRQKKKRSKRAKEKMLEQKQQRAEVKGLRKKVEF